MEALTFLLVIPLEACCHRQKVLSWLRWTASCWIAALLLQAAGLPSSVCGWDLSEDMLNMHWAV